MNNWIDKLKWRGFVLVSAELVVVGLVGLFAHINIAFPLLVILVEGIILYLSVITFKKELNKYDHTIREYVEDGFEDVLLYGNTGLIMYNEDYVITFMSDLFKDYEIDRIGVKLLSWLPETDELISGKTDSVTLSLDDRVYEVHRKENQAVLLFKDITDTHNYQKAFEDEKIVVGVFNLDNYDDTIALEDDIVVNNINAVLRTAVMEYAKQFGVLIKRTNDHERFTAILTEKIYARLLEDKFSIMNKIRKEARELEVPITLSMSFARGSSDLHELDELAVQLMDLAQTRGGDQVATKKIGEDVKYFGGSSEAVEKRSRVRVRVMANTLRELINKSSNVIICGHKEADFDCMGAAIGLSRMVTCYHKKVCIIAKTGGVESKLREALKKNEDALKDRIKFVSESEALNQLEENTLVVMVDHHNLNQSNGGQVLEKAKRIAIIDHHRRSTDLMVHPMLVYIEPAASSTSELITEFIPYVSNRLDISEEEATIMLGGMIVDTNNFSKRTSFKTYDAASALRKLGASPQLVDEYLKDTYNEMELKNHILSKAEQVYPGIIVACVDNKNLTRTLISQAADQLMSIQNIKATFVIAKTSEDLTSVSARSNGSINVQVIMENMHGGGHMTAAALQRKNSSIQELKDELMNELTKLFEEETHEGNIKG